MIVLSRTCLLMNSSDLVRELDMRLACELSQLDVRLARINI